MELMAQLHQMLPNLRLKGMQAALEHRNRQAIEAQWSYLEFLAALLENEAACRDQKQLATRLRQAKINTSKTLEAFDFHFNPALNRQEVLLLATCEFVCQKRNVLLCGPTGVSKSHLAQALAHEACRLGFRALYVSTHEMLRTFMAAGAVPARMASSRTAVVVEEPRVKGTARILSLALQPEST